MDLTGRPPHNKVELTSWLLYWCAQWFQ